MQSHIFVCKFLKVTLLECCSHRGNIILCNFNYHLQWSSPSRNSLPMGMLPSESPVVRRSALYLTSHPFCLTFIFLLRFSICCYCLDFFVSSRMNSHPSPAVRSVVYIQPFVIEVVGLLSTVKTSTLIALWSFRS